jgi:hypothetical protein
LGEKASDETSGNPGSRSPEGAKVASKEIASEAIASKDVTSRDVASREIASEEIASREIASLARRPRVLLPGLLHNRMSAAPVGSRRKAKWAARVQCAAACRRRVAAAQRLTSTPHHASAAHRPQPEVVRADSRRMVSRWRRKVK